MPAPDVRKGMPSSEVSREVFEKRFRSRFTDPAFAPLAKELRGDHRRRVGRLHRQPQGAAHAQGRRRLRRSRLRAVGRLARGARRDRRGAAATRRSGDALAHPDRQRLNALRAHVPRRDVEELAARRDRAATIAESADSRPTSSTSAASTSEYGRDIHPCKSCVSTAMPLCHWPCSCYPNYALGQAHDWMNEIYPLWVAAHGIMIVTPVNWYQAPGPLKADDGPPGLRRRRQSRSDARRTARPSKRRRRLSSRAGIIRVTSPGDCFRPWCTPTPPARRRCAAS